MTTVSFRNTLLSTACALTTLVPGIAHAADANAAADDARTRSGTSTAGSKGQANDADALSTADIIVTGTKAAEDAVITSSLTTTQPQAVVGRNLIDNVAPATADFNSLVLLTPGVTISGTANGVGLSESKVQIRGFQDGEYNVTYDSIPFADTNNPTHHSTAFFPSNTIESVIVNRGPGNASQLGQATYGGNLNIYSRAVTDKMGAQFDASYGSFNTYLLRGELQSGKVASLGDTQFLLAGQYLKSDGALTFEPIESKNIFFKAVVPIGASNTLTVLSTYNRNYYYQSDTGTGTCGNTLGTTTTLITEITGQNCSVTSTIGIYGQDYGLVGDPAVLTVTPAAGAVAARVANPYAQSYYTFQRTDKTTDFSIIRLQSDLGSGFTLDNRVYMYAYTNNTSSGNDATGRTANTVTLVSGGAATAGIPIYDKGNKYRVGGYIGQLNYEFDKGRIRVGGWYETAATDRRLINFDGITGQPNYREAAITNADGTTQPRNVRYIQHSNWRQFQIFGEVEYEVLPGLLVTPGLKYVSFKRGITAPVNQTSRTPINTSATFKKTLPFLTANYTIANNWSAYFQYAKGMYVPDLSSFYAPTGTTTQQGTLATALGRLEPQTSTNYQLGTVYHGSRLTLDFDIYKIEVNNKIAANPDPAFTGTLINIGTVKYKGVEGDATYTLPFGLTGFINASLSDAHSQTTGAQISRAAEVTGAAGLLYQHKGISAAVTHKVTGATFANEYNGLPGRRLYRIAPYAISDASVSYDFGRFRIGVQVSNIFDNRSVASIGTSANGIGAVNTTTGPSGATTPGATQISAVPNLPGATAATLIQSGYGPFDTILFNPPRAITGSVRVKF